MSDEARSTRDRVFDLVPALVDTVLGWVRRLAMVGVALALVDVALFVSARRGQATPVAIVLAVVLSLLPALALGLLGRRFAAFRDGIVTIGRRLPELTTLPRSISEGFEGLTPDLERTTHKRLPGRLVGTARGFARISKVARPIVDQHSELLSASSTVVQYGPRDVLLAVYGVVGLVAVALAVPVLALWAIFG